MPTNWTAPLGKLGNHSRSMVDAKLNAFHRLAAVATKAAFGEVAMCANCALCAKGRCPTRRPINRWTCGLLALLLCCQLGCREHPQVTSRQSLDLIKQVYTACNTRNDQRLNDCRQALAELVAAGQLSAAEQASFTQIIETAAAGQWEEAQRSSLQFARDQVR